MRILFTGASGFLGQNIKLQSDQNQVITLGRSYSNNLFINLSKDIPDLSECDMIVHASGKAHRIAKSKEDIEDFYNSNVQSTLNLIKGLERQSEKPKSFIYISSVAVYGRLSGELIKESEPLLASDPYGHSKIQAEDIIVKWCKENNIVCTILRLPLLIGNNPKGNLLAMINGIKKGYYFNIGGGQARKSMLLASDISNFILNFHHVGGTFNLTDGYHPSFQELSSNIAAQLNKKHVFNMPLNMAKLLAKGGDLLGSKFPINTSKLEKITATLTFDDSKARSLGWESSSVLESFKL